MMGEARRCEAGTRSALVEWVDWLIEEPDAPQLFARSDMTPVMTLGKYGLKRVDSYIAF